MSLEGDDTTLLEWTKRIKESLFNLSLRLKWLKFDQSPGMTSASVLGVKLPKLEVPTFDWNIMNWTAFWEPFNALINLKELNDVYKLTYFRQALKDGPAQYVIKGLSRTAKNYRKLSNAYRSAMINPG